MLRGPLDTQKKERIYEFALTHPTGSAFASFLKEMYGYEGFPDEAAGLDYVYSGTDSIELHWTDEHGEKEGNQAVLAAGCRYRPTPGG